MRKLYVIHWYDILAITAVIAIIVVIYLVARKAKVAKIKAHNLKLDAEEKPLHDWVMLVIPNRYNYQKLVRIGPPPEGGETYRNQKRLETAVSYYKAGVQELKRQALRAQEARNAAARLSRRIRQIMLEDDLLTRFWALHKLFQNKVDRMNLGGRSQKWITAYLVSVLPFVMDALFEIGTKRSLRDMMFLESSYYDMEDNLEGIDWDYHGRIILGKYQRPAGWDDKITATIKNPSLADFNSPKKELNPGKLLLMAGEALEENSIVKAKLVLAYCNDGPTQHRQDVESLRGELSKLVARYHREHTLRPMARVAPNSPS